MHRYVPLLLLITSIVFGYDTVVPARDGVRITKNVLFVVDVSGSMTDGVLPRINSAITDVLQISQQPVDEMQIACITFDQDTARWPGKPDPDNKVTEGWAAMPDPGALDDLSGFIHHACHDGGTVPLGAFNSAFHEHKKNLTIVIVSDGEWDRAALLTIADWQKERVRDGYGEAVVAALNVGAERASTNMRALGEMGGGEYFESGH